MFDRVLCGFPRPIAGAVLVTSIVMLCAGPPDVAAAANAAGYPSKPLRFVVTFAPGGGTDVFARAIALKFTEAWGQSVIVDNRAGGNGNIGADMVAKAPADGYTVLVTTNATIVINPHLVKLPYDPVRDLAPISQLATLPFVLLVHPSLPVKSVGELIALAKAKPGQLNFGSSGGGGGAHLSGEMMKTAAKIDMTHVPYKGAAPALVALLGGEVQFMFVSILTATPLIESNRVRAIAVSGLKRSPALPNVPGGRRDSRARGFRDRPVVRHARSRKNRSCDRRQALSRNQTRARARGVQKPFRAHGNADRRQFSGRICQNHQNRSRQMGGRDQIVRRKDGLTASHFRMMV